MRNFVSNQITLIGLVSCKNYHRRPMLLQTWHKGVIRQHGTSSKDGLEGDFWEEGLPSCIQSQHEFLRRRSVHNPLWQFIPVLATRTLRA